MRCPAKINLGFWITGRRSDGYHEVDTILQAVTLEDELLLEPGPASGIRLETRGRRIPGPGPNLVERAWELLAERAGIKNSGIGVRLTKRIPVAAGLGGGSSDAAGLLAGANALLGLGLATGDLAALGAELGSDVPFFFRGGTARAMGRGERVRPICPPPPLWVALVSPPFGISTSWAYGKARIHLTPSRGGGNVLATALASGDVVAIAHAMRNEFEDVVLPEHPMLAAWKRALERAGAARAILVGSGSTLCGFARTHQDAWGLANGIARLGAEVAVVRTLERGVAVAPLA